MEENTKHYELSVWDDMSNTPYKLFTIASDTMESPAAAYNIVLNRKVNGEISLTFSMAAKYFDEQTGEFEHNPYIDYLINERTVKLKREKDDGNIEWLDFAIKDVQQDSNGGVYNFTAKDLWVQELAKNGFSLEFDKELRNNTGTAKELAKTILEGTQWKVDDGDFLLEYGEEPVYKCTVKSGKTIQGQDIYGNEITISGGNIIYVPYSMFQNRNENFFQFISRSTPINNDTVELDDENILLHTVYHNYYVRTNTAWQSDTSNRPSWIESDELFSDKNKRGIRGRCLSFNIEQAYDSNLDKYVTRYNRLVSGTIETLKNEKGETIKNEKGEDVPKEYYGYKKTKYLDPEAVFSLVANGQDFKTTSGWYPAMWTAKDRNHGINNETNVKGTVELVYYPNVVSDWTGTTQDDELKIGNVSCHLQAKGLIFNSGILSNRTMIDGFTAGERYIFKIKLRCLKAGSLHMRVREYEIKDGAYVFKHQSNCSANEHCTYNNFFTWKEENVTQMDEFQEFYGIIPCERTISADSLKNTKLGIFLSLPQSKIESVSFYRAVLKPGKSYGSDQILDYYQPGGIELNANNLIYNEYYYYDPKTAPKEEGEVVNLAADPLKEDSSFVPVYNTKSEKKRTISGKETNRFDLLQKICESFECWMRINIQHNEDGTVHKKSVSFHEYVGSYNYAGFKYGVNLKGIKRKLDSNQIVTKMIVKNNSNEFAKNGFCSITRAESNPSGTNVIYDFGYFEHQGICNMSEALYNTETGLYPQLKKLTNESLKLINNKTALENSRVKLEAIVTTERERLNAAKEQEIEIRQELIDLTGFTYEQFLSDISPDGDKEEQYESWKKSNEVLSIFVKIYHLQQEQANAKYILETKATSTEDTQGAEQALDSIKKKIEKVDRLLEQTREWIKEEEDEFYKAHSRFIQEGFWISEDYTDDNRYYLDALATAYTSSRPKITYTIDVFEMSKIEGYENYYFNVGDKTFVEDPEFFGYKDIQVGKVSYRTPRQEEVVISEISEGIDDPTKNTIKVQNYKTQFDDLFQRIAATTEQLQYTTGRYERTTKALEADGSLSHQLLQDAVTQNGLTIAQAGTQSVSMDERGVITIDQKNPAKQIRMIGGGLFVTKDGGETWRTGVTGDGINADVITTGQLNAGEINIATGKVPTHRWDKKGITAYETSYNTDTGTITSSNNANFVRFDEFGIYGIRGNADFDARVGEPYGVEKIEENALFSLTWNGVKIGKGNKALRAQIDENGNGYITIGGEGGISITSSKFIIGDKDYGISIESDKLTIGGSGGLEARSGGITIGDNYKMWLSPQGKEGTINFSANKVITKDFTIFSNNNFGVDVDGYLYAKNADIAGTITASGGEIAGWTIDEGKIYAGDGETIKTCVVQAPSPGISWVFAAGGTTHESYAGCPFRVSKNGDLYAEGGNIAGWTFDKEKFSNTTSNADDNGYYYTAYLQTYAPKDTGNFNGGRTAFAVKKFKKDANGNEIENTVSYPIDLKYGGSATITGVIHAQAGGSIAGWTINNSSLGKGVIGDDNSLFLSPSGRGINWNGTSWGTVSIGGSSKKNNWAITAGSNFGVDVDGNMYASSGKIAGWNIGNDGLSNGSIGLYPSGYIYAKNIEALPGGSIHLQLSLDSSGKPSNDEAAIISFEPIISEKESYEWAELRYDGIHIYKYNSGTVTSVAYKPWRSIIA